MKKFVNAVLILIIISMLAGTLVSCGVFVFLKKKSTLGIDEALLNIPKENSKTQLYYYKDGDASKPVLLTDNLVSSQAKYKYMPLSKIPQELIFAFVAIEDKRFYNHCGVDFLRSGKAIFNYVVRRSSSFGASTITQQVIKNLTGENQRTAKRKINEIFMAINLEKNHSKDEIMEIYLNIINLSCGCYGVGAAAEYYFSKEPADLSLCECATIAAITNNPSLYNPRKYPENTKKRRDLVLKCMLEQGYITEKEYNDATSKDIVLNIKETPNSKNSWFTETVIGDLLNDFTSLGYTKQSAYNKIFNGGLKIYTTVNPEVQKIVEKYYTELDLSTKDHDSPQSSMIIMNPHNGDILGVAGAIGKKSGELIQNYATDTKRPPGSAIKPLSVYAPLINDKSISWSTIVEDSPVIDTEEKQWPQNANRKYVGNIDISDAIANSVNTVAVKMLLKLGEKNSLSFLKDKLHIRSLISPENTSQGDANPVSLALGQTLSGITLRELVSGYGIFSEGNMSVSRSYYKVTDFDGNIIFDKRNNQESVLSYGGASVMTKLLEEVVTRGTAQNKITLSNTVSVAGKTGTTQNNCDRLFVGYTPSILAGVWCGYDYPEALDPALKNPSIKIWDEVMCKIYETEAYRNSPKEFRYSGDIIKMTYNKDTGLPATYGDSPDSLREGWFLSE